MLRDLLVAELVLLREELALLVLQARDLIGRLGDLRREGEIEEDADDDCAEAQVGVAECIQARRSTAGRQPPARSRACAGDAARARAALLQRRPDGAAPIFGLISKGVPHFLLGRWSGRLLEKGGAW